VSATDPKFQSLEALPRAAILNSRRVVRLIREAIDLLSLDLSGLTVLTEAAAGPYAVTPVIASLAGAQRVLALTSDSRYGSVPEVVAQTRALEQLAGIDKRAEIITDRTAAVFAEADIVTNLGFVRPIDEAAVQAMKPTAVVPLMCEAWEFRTGDVALAACRRRGIAVMATNEDYPGLDVFSYGGWLALKVLFDAQVEIHKSRILVVGGDKFARVIARQLDRSGADVKRVPDLRQKATPVGIDAILVADYTREDWVIGPGGDVEAEEFARRAPDVTVVQFAGRVDVAGLVAAGAVVHPGIPLDSHRMAATLADLGPRPVVELHAAGLKVGEITWRRARKASGDMGDGVEAALLCQEVPSEDKDNEA